MYDQLWSMLLSSGRHSIELLKSVESVQRRFTERLSGCGCGQLSYSSMLAKLNLDSVELRRFKADSTHVYDILFGLVDVSCADMFWCVTVSHVVTT